MPRSALRQGNMVWVVDKNNRLNFRKVEIARFQGDNILVISGLEGGESVVVTLLKAVTDGMVVRDASLDKGDRS